MTKGELLLAYTGRDSGYWIAVIQHEIGKTFAADPTNPHPACGHDWVLALTERLAYEHHTWMTRPRRFERFRKPRAPYDENISLAFLLSTILAIWAVRISHAKAHDPRRPLPLRRAATQRNRQLVAALHDAIYDESWDSHYFDQPWQYPYAPDATSGTFV